MDSGKNFATKFPFVKPKRVWIIYCCQTVFFDIIGLENRNK